MDQESTDFQSLDLIIPCAMQKSHWPAPESMTVRNTDNQTLTTLSSHLNLKMCLSGIPHPQRVVAFSMEGTIGTWAAGWIAYQTYIAYAQTPPPIWMFVQCYLQHGGARPYLAGLLQVLSSWLESGRLVEVVVFTNMSNSDGWVTFLCDCIEEYAGVPGLFGRCFSFGECPRARTEDGENVYLTDLSRVSVNTGEVVLLSHDHRYTINGIGLGMPNYNPDIDTSELEAQMVEALPRFASEIRERFARYRLENAPRNLNFDSDDALKYSIRVLDELFA